MEELPQGLYVSPDILRKICIFFSGRLKSDDIEPLEQSLDNGEDVKVVWVDVKDILRLSNDMKTILAVTYFQEKSRIFKK